MSGEDEYSQNEGDSFTVTLIGFTMTIKRIWIFSCNVNNYAWQSLSKYNYFKMTLPCEHELFSIPYFEITHYITTQDFFGSFQNDFVKNTFTSDEISKFNIYWLFYYWNLDTNLCKKFGDFGKQEYDGNEFRLREGLLVGGTCENSSISQKVQAHEILSKISPIMKAGSLY